jgi:predicted helicase
VFNYIYAILHSPTYRSRYAEFLKIDFPRIPLTSDYELFLKLSALGGELVKLHLLKHGMLAESKARFEGMGDNAVEKVRYNDVTERVHINAMQYFTGVQKKHWEFMVGGYPVLYKWLKEREKAKRSLNLEDIQHFQKMVAAVDMTITLMADIDRAIPKWPIE